MAITSSWHPDANTHIEPVRYGKGSNAMGLINTLLTDGGTRRHRWLQFFVAMLRNPLQLRAADSRASGPSGSIILLVMQIAEQLHHRVAQARGSAGSG